MTEPAKGKAHFVMDNSAMIIQLGRWADYVQSFIDSLGLTETKHCNDVKAIGCTVRDDEQHLCIPLRKPEYIGHVIISYYLIENTDKFSLSFERARCYTQ